MEHKATNFIPKSFLYSRRTVRLLCLTVQILFMFAGCSRDPLVRKQKFIEEGDRYFAHEKIPEALLTYGRALQLDPKSAAVHYRVAKCQLKLENWASAYRELELTVALEPQNWPAHMDLGKLLLAGDRAPDAKDQAKLILGSNPGNLGAQILLSEADAKLGNLKDALQEAADAVSSSPNEATTYLNLAAIQQVASAFREAETNLLKAQSLSPASELPPMALGKFYQEQMRWPDAEKAFRSAMIAAPKDPAPRAALAEMYLAQGQNTLAEKVLLETKAQLSNDPAAYRILGAYYLGQGDTSKALTEFASLTKEHPADLRVRKSYVQLLIVTHQLDEASRLTGDILKISPQDSDALILKGEIFLQNGKPDDALLTLQQAIKDAPANAIAHFQLGMAQMAKGNANQAESEWREAVRMNPHLAEAWIALGTNAIQRRDWSALEQIAGKLKKIAPQAPGGYLFHATARINQGDAASAEADLVQLIQVSHQSPMAYAKLGQLRASQKRWGEAENFYHEALNRDPDFLDAIRGTVDLEFGRGKPAEALQFVQAKIDRKPGNAALYLIQGDLYLREKRLVDAERSFARCIELDNRNLAGFTKLGQVQQALGNTSGALTNYQRAIAIAPNNSGLYTAMGVAYEGLGNWQEAQAAYQRALAIQPDDALPANNLAYLMLEHGGNVNVALTLAQAARRGLPNLPNSADTLGWAYFQNGAYSLAGALLEEAVKGAPSNAAYRYHLGMTYQKLNDSKRARSEFEKSIRLGPHAPSAEKASHALSELSGD